MQADSASLASAAVERLELARGKLYLSVFEFSGDRVSRIIEYWQ